MMAWTMVQQTASALPSAALPGGSRPGWRVAADTGNYFYILDAFAFVLQTAGDTQHQHSDISAQWK